MRFIYNEEKIQELLCAVSELTGISIAFLDPNNRFLFTSAKEQDFCSLLQCDKEHRQCCNNSDNQLLQNSHRSGTYESHICYAGLYDAAIPMVKNGVLAGSVIMGRVRTSGSPEVPAVTKDPDLVKMYQQLPCLTDKQLESLRILLPNILFESAIEVVCDPIMDEICEYIDENIASELYLGDLCSRFHISKNALYQRFRERYNCTVNAYIVNCRIAIAKQLLSQSTEPVYAVAERAGLKNSTYFSKLFKKYYSVSPLNYRKQAIGAE